MPGAMPGLICSGDEAGLSVCTGIVSVAGCSPALAARQPGRDAEPYKSSENLAATSDRTRSNQFRRSVPSTGRIVTVAVMPETSGTPAGNLVDGDADRHALRKAYPGVNRIDVGQPLGARRSVRYADAPSDRLHVSDDRFGVTHQLRLSAIANTDPRHFRFFEIAIDPKAVGIDHRDVGYSRRRIIPHPQQQVGDIAIDGTEDLGPFKVQFGLSKLLLRRIELGLRLSRVAGIGLLLLGCRCKNDKCWRRSDSTFLTCRLAAS